MDVNDISSRPETTDDVPESCQEPNRKEGDMAKEIIIPTETANYIMGHAHSAFVSTRTMSDMEDALICDGGGATCTLTRMLNCWFSSVYSGAGSEPSVNHMAKQVVIALSVTPKDVRQQRVTFTGDHLRYSRRRSND